LIFNVLRKMFQNMWLSICLLLGFVLTVATVSSIPMFTRGASFNEYIRALRNSQSENGIYPGSALIGKALNSSDYTRAYTEADRLVTDDLITRLGLPVQTSVKYLKTDSNNITLFKSSHLLTSLSIASLSNLKDHVRIISGRMNNPGIIGDTIEAVITATDMFNHQLVLNKPYDVKCGAMTTQQGKEYKLSLKVVIVGVVEPQSMDDPYWFFNFIGNNNYPVFYIDQDVLMKEFFIEKPYIGVNAQWYSAYDYNGITIDSMETIKEVSKTWEDYRSEGKISLLEIPIVKTFVKYTQSEKLLNSIMWLFNILVFVILAFYILMISKLIIDYDKDEIALITSRGGGKLHLLKGYLTQGLSTGIAALTLGPLLGIFICQIIGSSNSFMEFTNRKTIPAVLNTRVYLYSMITLLTMIAVMLITSALFSNTSIIKYKQGKGRSQNRYLIFRIILSASLLGFSIYWLLSYKSLAKRAGGFMPNTDGLPIDPMLFLNAALLIIGAGLFLTNLFPYLVRLVFGVGKRIWPTTIYTAFIQVGRSAGQEQFLMLFIVLTLSIGVFSANSARTINMNATDTIRYQSGADITLKGNWKHIDDENVPTPGDYIGASYGDSVAQAKIDSYKKRTELGLLTDKYIEPDFNQYAGLKGVENAARVYVEESSSIYSESVSRIRFMAINTDEFGKAAWFRPQLLPYHWYEYLNLLADVPNGVLLSSSFKKQNIKAGDEITLKVAKQEVSVIVCDFIDYWPSFTPKGIDVSGNKKDNYLIVANYGYIFNQIPIKPYEVWIKKKPGFSGSDILNEMKDKGIEPLSFADTDTKIAQMKRVPVILCTNGSLTLGFILTIFICLSGFLIYWVISLKKRSLQFGIMRAMGISSKGVIGMLSFEHLLISGSAIFAGISVGAIASRIFIPLYELFYNTDTQALPFRVIAQRADYIRLYAVVAVMLLIALSILFMITRNIKVTQAIKLGED
jgi:putative ABC transport system permease protein